MCKWEGDGGKGKELETEWELKGWGRWRNEEWGEIGRYSRDKVQFYSVYSCETKRVWAAAWRCQGKEATKIRWVRGCNLMQRARKGRCRIKLGRTGWRWGRDRGNRLWSRVKSNQRARLHTMTVVTEMESKRSRDSGKGL